MSSRKPAQSPYTNHWGGKEGGSNPTPVAMTHWLRAITPSGLRVTDLYLAIYPAMIKVPVGTCLLRGLLLYSCSEMNFQQILFSETHIPRVALPDSPWSRKEEGGGSKMRESRIESLPPPKESGVGDRSTGIGGMG